MQHKQHFFVLTLFILPLFCIAQKHDNVWMWGYNNFSSHPLLGGVNMDFSTSPPHIYPQKKKINFRFYCGVCSDSSGHLAFYTNGISIRDTTHNRMLNGDTLNPGPIWLDWQNDSYPNGPFCFALPAPGKHNQYYFFHVGSAITTLAITTPFYYSIIDTMVRKEIGYSDLISYS